jgi:hypothetical protein
MLNLSWQDQNYTHYVYCSKKYFISIYIRGEIKRVYWYDAPLNLSRAFYTRILNQIDREQDIGIDESDYPIHCRKRVY